MKIILEKSAAPKHFKFCCFWALGMLHFCIIASKISCCCLAVCKSFRLFLEKSKIPTLRLKNLNSWSLDLAVAGTDWSRVVFVVNGVLYPSPCYHGCESFQ